MLNLDNVTDAHAAATSIAFGHQYAVAAHGERGHHGRAPGAMDSEHVGTDEVCAGDEFEGREQGDREIEQEGIATMEGHEYWKRWAGSWLHGWLVGLLVCGGLGSLLSALRARYVIVPRLRNIFYFLRKTMKIIWHVRKIKFLSTVTYGIFLK